MCISMIDSFISGKYTTYLVLRDALRVKSRGGYVERSLREVREMSRDDVTYGHVTVRLESGVGPVLLAFDDAVFREPGHEHDVADSLLVDHRPEVAHRHWNIGYFASAVTFIKRKMAFFEHACRNDRCNLVKTCILRMMPGERRRGAPGCDTLITSRSGQGHPWKTT